MHNFIIRFVLLQRWLSFFFFLFFLKMEAANDSTEAKLSKVLPPQTRAI